MSYQLEDLTKLQTLLRVDLMTRLERVVESGLEASMECALCGHSLQSWGLERSHVPSRNVTWKNACDKCGNPEAKYGFHDSVRNGTWSTWRAWESGRLTFEKDLSVVQAVWEHILAMPRERLYRLTKPMIMRKPLIDQLRESGWNLIFREPVHYDAPPSMETRYEAAALWECGFPDNARVWNLFSMPEHMELTQLVVKLIEDVGNHRVDSASVGSLGNIEGDDLKRWKTRCYEIKLSDRKKGDGAFELLAFIRGTISVERESA